MKAEELVRRQQEVAGWTVNLVSYRLGDRYHCTIDNVDPGARIADASGATREDAERAALAVAAEKLAATRRFPR